MTWSCSWNCLLALVIVDPLPPSTLPWQWSLISNREVHDSHHTWFRPRSRSPPRLIAEGPREPTDGSSSLQRGLHSSGMAVIRTSVRFRARDPLVHRAHGTGHHDAQVGPARGRRRPVRGVRERGSFLWALAAATAAVGSLALRRGAILRLAAGRPARQRLAHAALRPDRAGARHGGRDRSGPPGVRPDRLAGRPRSSWRPRSSRSPAAVRWARKAPAPRSARPSPVCSPTVCACRTRIACPFRLTHPSVRRTGCGRRPLGSEGHPSWIQVFRVEFQTQGGGRPRRTAGDRPTGDVSVATGTARRPKGFLRRLAGVAGMEAADQGRLDDPALIDALDQLWAPARPCPARGVFWRR